MKHCSQAVRSGLALIHDFLSVPSNEDPALAAKSDEDMTSSDEQEGEDCWTITMQQEKTRNTLCSIISQYSESILFVLTPPQISSSQQPQSQTTDGEEVEYIRLLDMCVSW